MLVNEKKRLRAVKRFLRLEFSKKDQLQEIANLAAQTCQTPIGLITLIDNDKQYIKFSFGTNLTETSRREAFCNFTINNSGLMVVPDALNDSRFNKNEFVTNYPAIRFYAGSPLRTQDKINIGTICILDIVPRELSICQLQVLEILGKEAVLLMEFDTILNILKGKFSKVKNVENNIRSIFNSSKSGHLLLNHDLKILDFNKSAFGFFKANCQLNIKRGMKIKNTLISYMKIDFFGHCLNALNGREHQEELRTEHDNEIEWWDVKFEPAYNYKGNLIGISFNTNIITKIVKQRQQLLDQSESLNKIAYLQSHELRKPVASIMGLIEVIKSQGYNCSKEDLSMLDKTAKELDYKIKMIVDYSS